jgi:putative alpha-1,2-mannosidase
MLDGQPWHKPWLPESFALHGGTLHFTLGSDPDKTWGGDPADAPPSFPPPSRTTASARH